MGKSTPGRSAEARERDRMIKAGELDPNRCGARTKRSGGTKRCQQFVVPFSTRCRLHGGKSPQAVSAADRRRAEATAKATLEDLGTTGPVKDPVGALEDLAGQAMDLTNALRDQVASLKEVGFKSEQGFEQTKAELTAYLSAMSRAESVLKSIISLGLDERRVQVQEAQVRVAFGAIQRGVRKAGLTSEVQALVLRCIVESLRNVSTDEAVASLPDPEQPAELLAGPMA